MSLLSQANISPCEGLSVGTAAGSDSPAAVADSIECVVAKISPNVQNQLSFPIGLLASAPQCFVPSLQSKHLMRVPWHSSSIASNKCKMVNTFFT